MLRDVDELRAESRIGIDVDDGSPVGNSRSRTRSARTGRSVHRPAASPRSRSRDSWPPLETGRGNRRDPAAGWRRERAGWRRVARSESGPRRCRDWLAMVDVLPGVTHRSHGSRPNSRPVRSRPACGVPNLVTVRHGRSDTSEARWTMALVGIRTRVTLWTSRTSSSRRRPCTSISTATVHQAPCRRPALSGSMSRTTCRRRR